MNIFDRIRASEKVRMPVLAGDPLGALQTFSTLKVHVGRWRSLRERVAGRGLLATILTVGGLTLLVKIVAAGKEVVVARQLGVGDAVDAFVVAFSLPNLTMQIITTSFNAALIPTYIEVRERAGAAAAQRLLSGVMFWSLGLLLLASALLALLFPLVLPFLAASFSPQKLAFTRLLFWTLLPVITITGVALNWTAALNAEGKFALPAAAPIITSLIIAGILLFRVHTWGVWGLAIGTLVGGGLEMALIGGYLRRQGFSLLPRWQSMDADLRQVMRQYGPLAGAAAAFSSLGIVDTAVAARLGPGSVAALNYGGKIVIMVMSVTSTAVYTSVLPHFSRLVVSGDWKGIREDLRHYSLLILLTLIPLALLISYFSLPLVRLGFQRGVFTPQDTRLVSHVQACFTLQIPFYTLWVLYLRLISALKMNSQIFLVFSANVVLNFVLDIVLAKYLGVAGIALSTTLVTVFSTSAFYLFLVRALPNQDAAGDSIAMGREQ